MLASGSDSGRVRVWDLRKLQKESSKLCDLQPWADLGWHRKPITSIEWHPTEDSVLATACADNTVREPESLAEFSVVRPLCAGRPRRKITTRSPFSLFLFAADPLPPTRPSAAEQMPVFPDDSPLTLLRALYYCVCVCVCVAHGVGSLGQGGEPRCASARAVDVRSPRPRGHQRVALASTDPWRDRLHCW
jgi:WD domain, G-beta repeat